MKRSTLKYLVLFAVGMVAVACFVLTMIVKF